MLNNFIPGFVPLKNAIQSSEFKLHNCRPNKCRASQAIDGLMNTTVVTKNEKWNWWSAELIRIAPIYKIYIYVYKYGFKYHAFDRFTVETALVKNRWKNCKGEYKMKEPTWPHIVECDSSTWAKFIRVSVRTGKLMYLTEVKVFEPPDPGDSLMLDFGVNQSSKSVR